jgi:hypothetical protein
VALTHIICLFVSNSVYYLKAHLHTTFHGPISNQVRTSHGSHVGIIDGMNVGWLPAEWCSYQVHTMASLEGRYCTDGRRTIGPERVLAFPHELSTSSRMMTSRSHGLAQARHQDYGGRRPKSIDIVTSARDIGECLASRSGRFTFGICSMGDRGARASLGTVVENSPWSKREMNPNNYANCFVGVWSEVSNTEGRI